MKTAIINSFFLQFFLFFTISCTTIQREYSEKDLTNDNELFEKIKEECRLQKRPNFGKTCTNVREVIIEERKNKHLLTP